MGLEGKREIRNALMQGCFENTIVLKFGFHSYIIIVHVYEIQFNASLIVYIYGLLL